MTDLAAGLRAFHDGWRAPAREHLARIARDHPDRPVADAMLAMLRYQEGDRAGAEVDAAALTTTPHLEARRWAWLVVALCRLATQGDARAAVRALEALADEPTWRGHAALMTADLALRTADGTTALEALDRGLAAAAAVDDPAARGWLRYDALVIGMRWWPPARAREVADAAARDFTAADLPYGTASLAILDPEDAEATAAACRVFTERGRTGDAYRVLVTRASRLHQSGALDAADAAYDEVAPLAGAMGPTSLSPVRAVLALQLGRDEEALRHLAAVGPGLLPGVGQAVAFVRAALAPDGDASTALRDAWLAHQGTPSPLAAFAAAAAADRLEGRASAARTSRARAFAIAAWPDRDPEGRARVEARHAAAITAGAPIPCGGFDLERRLGAGGMGEVWAATWAHADGLGTFAVKLVREERVADLRARRAFEREIRAVAAVSHPGVVPIVDLGTTPPAGRTAGRLEPGTPWFAMPLASGSLHAWRGRLAWPDLRRALASLLAALAHVHAHGILHLDVKPENLLVPDPRDPTSLWLADFGQAVTPDAPDVLGGTPAFMAPEQFRGKGLGPWTDLYAVGAVAWDLATGEPPFGHGPVPRLRQAHLLEEPPPLRPRVAVPPGFEAWVRGLLAKAPSERPAQAADAARALAALGEADARPPDGDEPTGSVAWTTDDVADGPDPEVGDAPAPDPDPLPEPPRPGALPPWRSLAHRPRGFAPSPALLHHRTPAFVGRDEERDRLWRALSAVVERGGTELAVISGPAGCGAGRLAEWIGRAAAEAGVARLVEGPRAAVGPGPTVWWLDGLDAAPWSAVTEVLAGEVPTLVLWSVRADELAGAPGAAARLRVLDPLWLELGRLDAATLDRVASSLVPLRASTREQIVAAADGLPVRVVRLLRRAHDRGELRITPTGWSLPPGWSPPPTGEGPAPSLSPPERSTLEVGATLGDPIDVDEWDAVCAALGRPSPLPSLVGWSDRGLLVLGPGSASFRDPSVREALRSLPGAEPRVQAAAAEVLAARGAQGDRVARHLLAAGDADRALAALRAAVRTITHPGGLPPTVALADLADAIVGARGDRPGAPDWTWAAFQRAAALDVAQDYPALREHCGRVERALSEVGARVPLTLSTLAARAERWAGDPERAVQRFAEAAASAERAGHFLAARLHHERGTLARELGRREEAREAFEDVVRTATDAPPDRLLAGLAQLELGRDAEAERLLEGLRSHPTGDQARQAESALAELHRRAGRLARAEAHAREALARATSRHERSLHAASLAVILAERGAVPKVLALLDTARPSRGARTAALQRAIVALLDLLRPSDRPWSLRWSDLEADVAAAGETPAVAAAARVVAARAGAPPEFVARLLAVGAPRIGEETFDSSID